MLRSMTSIGFVSITVRSRLDGKRVVDQRLDDVAQPGQVGEDRRDDKRYPAMNRTGVVSRNRSRSTLGSTRAMTRPPTRAPGRTSRRSAGRAG